MILCFCFKLVNSIKKRLIIAVKGRFEESGYYFMLARIAAKIFFDQLGQDKNYRILSNIKDVIAECGM